MQVSFFSKKKDFVEKNRISLKINSNFLEKMVKWYENYIRKIKGETFYARWPQEPEVNNRRN